MTRVLWLSLLLGCGATSSQGTPSAHPAEHRV